MKKLNIKGTKLIFLAITIIILFSLAGITISKLTNENGLLKRQQFEERNNNSLIGEISKIQNSGYSSISINGRNENEQETVNYNIHSIVYNGNLVLDGITEVEGATLNSNAYEFGDKDTDVAKQSSEDANTILDATNMVVLKVNGDLTVNENILLTACKSDNGYGGPKGMFIYCTGTLINNGTISMTARGARAEGQNVYLFENADGSYEYIPAEGGAGGDRVIAWENQSAYGRNGKNGSNRQTGGGGSGGANASDAHPVAYSGIGGKGTSFSGGPGGGGIDINCYSTIYAADGSNTGGEGGAGRGLRYSSGWEYRYAGGGAGNPGGNGGGDGLGNQPAYKGEDGTGGLLVIYTNNLNSTGIIESNGSNGSRGGRSEGGSSGGGSINVFYKNEISVTGEIQAKGGNELGTGISGGKGGNGCVSIGNVSTGEYVSDIEDLKLEEIKFDDKSEYNIQIESKPDTAEISWSSSDENIATVDNNGKVTLVSGGTAIITCTAKTKIGIELEATCEVTTSERLYLYYHGNQFESITGGYTESENTGETFTTTFAKNKIYIDSFRSGHVGGVYTTNKIDLTGYKKIKVCGEISSCVMGANGICLSITDSPQWGTGSTPASSFRTVYSGSANKQEQTFEMEIPQNVTEAYICCGSNTSEVYIKEIWLEK